MINLKSKIKSQRHNAKFKIPVFCRVFCIFCFLLTTYNLQLTTSLVYAQQSLKDNKEEEAFFVAKKAFEDGFYDVSLNLFERFLKNYPDSKKIGEVNLLIGECFFHQGNFLAALDRFERLINQPFSKDIQDAVFYWIAEVHFKGNNFTKAASYYQKIIDNFPKSLYFAAANYSLGWCLFQEHDFQQAVRYFQVVEEKFPKESYAKESTFKIIECLYNLKDYARLKDRLKAYIKTYAQDTSKVTYLYFYLAEADYYLDNFPEAAEEYTKVLSNTNDEKMLGLSQLGLAWTYLKMKKYKEAESAFKGVNIDSLEKTNQNILLLGKAVLMSETKRYFESGKIYDQILHSGKSDELILSQAYLGKADAAYNLSDYKQAIAVYKQALENFSLSGSAEILDKLHYGLAWSYLKEGQFKEAIDEFQRVVKQSEDKIVKVSALCQIGDTYKDSGNYTKALEAYDNILKDYPDSLYSDYVQYQLGVTMLKTGNYDGAILAFQNLKNKFPNSKLLDDASYALGLSYFQQEDYNSSKEVFEKFQSDFKDSYLSGQAMYLLGTSLYNLGKFNEAIEVFKNIIKAYNYDSDLVQKAEYEIADCLYRKGQEKEAMERFKVLRSKYPDSSLTSEIIWWLAEYYYRHKDLNLARRYFLSLVQDFPKSNLVPSAYYALASIYEEENNYEEAVKSFQRVIETNKSDLGGTAAVAIADIYIKQGKIELALEKYKATVKDYANLTSLVYPKIGDTYRKIGDYNQAIDYYRKSLEVVPTGETASIQFKIAETKESEGKLNEAIEEYLKVDYLYSKDNQISIKSLLRVAQIYETKENFKEALNIYKKVISLDTQEAKYAQERIEWIRTNVK